MAFPQVQSFDERTWGDKDYGKLGIQTEIENNVADTGYVGNGNNER